MKQTGKTYYDAGKMFQQLRELVCLAEDLGFNS